MLLKPRSCYQSSRKLSALSLMMSVSIFMLTQGCSKKKADQPTIEKYCHEKILDTIKKRPLSRVERSFFKDGKARGILKAEQLSPLDFAEGRSSATAVSYVQEFSFVDDKGRTVKLIRDEKNGGIDVKGGNIVTPRIQCTVTWGLFKGEVMRDQLKVIMVKLDKLQQRMRALDSIVEGSW